MATKKLMGTAAGVMVILATTLACINASPSECIQAAEEAGLPDEVIEQLKNPGDLNPTERFALNRALNKAGIADACGEIAGDTEQTEDPERPTPTVELSARIPEDDEHRRRCRFWALNNFQPIVYQEFVELDPEKMDDLDRILWRSKLNPKGHLGYYSSSEKTPSLRDGDPGIDCRDYWAEPLDSENADLRNHGFEAQCRENLEKRITGRYGQLAKAINYEDNSVLAYKTANQYVRILQWLDTSGEDLLEAERPPYTILMEQSRYPYAHIRDDHGIPNKDVLASYQSETDAELDLNWLGILTATGMSDNSLPNMTACHFFYPQVFYGYWVPSEPRNMLENGDEREMDLIKYDPSTTPIFLPKTVDAQRVREGYPLGKTGDWYYRCSTGSETEEAGYYFVDHPTGAYCERIR